MTAPRETVLFVDRDGNEVDPSDPTAVRAEITLTEDNGHVTRTYADVGGVRHPVDQAH